MRRVVVAGATGFVGSAVLEDLGRDNDVVGLTRRPGHEEPATSGDGGGVGIVTAPPLAPAPAAGVRWRTCDLFSLLETERALQGADVAVYLVHSMLPSARLTQGSFEDLDLLLADTFARAAARAGVRRIVYLGGLIPDEPDLSQHLSSRLEVERVFRMGPVPVVALRAGLVVGPNGSSFRMVANLSRRLPVMLTPSWTRSPTQPVALADVVAAVRAALDAPGLEGESFDLACPDVVSYSELLRRTGRALGHERTLVAVPFFSARLSVLWVSLVTGSPRALVAPLVQSLKHRMVARDTRLQEGLGLPRTPLDVALRDAVEHSERPGRGRRKRAVAAVDEDSTVRSVQRLPLPPGFTAESVAHEYAAWLPRFFRPFLRVETEGPDAVRFLLRGLGRPLLTLRLARERSTPDRQLLWVTGGLLARTSGRGGRGRLEFREVLGGAWVMAAVHDFQPTMPWWVYLGSQARVHLWVMRGFGRHLARLASGAGGQRPATPDGPAPAAPQPSAAR